MARLGSGDEDGRGTLRRRVAILAAGLVGLAFVATAGLTVREHAFAHRAAARMGPTAHIISPPPPPSAAPSQTPTPPPPVPRDGLRIRMPEIGIDLPIVEGDGYDAPLYKAAHYPGTTWPGEGGRSVIYAHARVGMFGPLFGGRVGQHIDIAAPNGEVRHYTVREYYPRWPIADTRWLQPGDHEQVLLITCTTYNYNDPRIIVVGEPD